MHYAVLFVVAFYSGLSAAAPIARLCGEPCFGEAVSVLACFFGADLTVIACLTSQYHLLLILFMAVAFVCCSVWLHYHTVDACKGVEVLRTPGKGV